LWVSIDPPAFNPFEKNILSLGRPYRPFAFAPLEHGFPPLFLLLRVLRSPTWLDLCRPSEGLKGSAATRPTDQTHNGEHAPAIHDRSPARSRWLLLMDLRDF
jgi:hypothetical protein